MTAIARHQPLTTGPQSHARKRPVKVAYRSETASQMLAEHSTHAAKGACTGRAVGVSFSHTSLISMEERCVFRRPLQPLFEGVSYLLTILVLSRLATWRRPLNLRVRISAAVTTVDSELPTPLITIVGLLSSFKTFAA